MRKKRTKKGFTLVEILVVMSIFSLVSMVALNAFFSSYKVQQSSSAQNALILESRILMDKITTLIAENKIDYEEYFRQCVVLKKCPLINAASAQLNANDSYGQEDGLYAWQFFDPGYKDAARANKDGFGLLCQKADLALIDFPSGECSSGPLRFSEDINVGKFFLDPGPGTFNAFSAGKYQGNNFSGQATDEPGQVNILQEGSAIVSQLYLKDPESRQKMILAQEKHADNAVVSQLVLDNMGLESIQNNEVTVLSNHGNFSCNNCVDHLGLRSDFTDEDAGSLFEQAVPISPFRLNIQELWFRIEPLQDIENFFTQPETEKIAPNVTVFMRIKASNASSLPILSNTNFDYVLTSTVVADIKQN